MNVDLHTDILIARPPGDVFDVAVACETLPRILRPVGPIPGVAQVEMPGGAPLETGARRRVTMTDGSVVEEEILCLERPREHRYRWLNPPAFPFSLVVRRGEGTWTFAAEGQGTRVSWRYHFELTSPLARPLAALVMIFFRRWMVRGLGELKGLFPGA